MAWNVTDLRQWAQKRLGPPQMETSQPPPPAPTPQPTPQPAQESFGGLDGSGNIFAEDDLGWMGLDPSSGMNFTELTPIDRIRVVRRARIYYSRDAMSRQAVRLHTSYAIGRGLSIKARVGEGERAEDPGPKALQADADAFWEHPDNSYVFSFEAQHENSDKLVVDGELYFLLYPSLANEDDLADVDAPGDTVTRVRVVDDCLQISRVITNPEDSSEPWYYLREWSVNNRLKQALYPDYRLFLRDERDDANNLRLPDVPEYAGLDLSDIELKTDVFIRHVKQNTLGQRGISTLSAMLDWAKVNRNYLEDRATVSRAFSRFAWKRMVKGPASAVAAFGRRAASAIGLSGPPQAGMTAVPPAPAGATLTTNSGVDWEAMTTPEGGKNAYTESRNFRLMGFMSVGFAEHYFGDGSMGTRATSKSMERPVELLLTDYQTLWKQVYTSLFAFDLKARGRDYDLHAVWVDAPQILEDDTVAVVMSYVSLIGVLPGLGVDEVVVRLLNALGIDSPQDVLPKIREREKEMYAFDLQKAAITAGLDLNAPVDLADPQAMQKQIMALQTFIGMITDPNNMTQLPGPKSGPQFGPSVPQQTLRTRIPAPAGTKPSGESSNSWEEGASLRKVLVEYVIERWSKDHEGVA